MTLDFVPFALYLKSRRLKPVKPFGVEILSFNGYCLFSLWLAKRSWIELFGTTIFSW